MLLKARHIRLAAPLCAASLLLLCGCSGGSASSSNVRETTGVDDFDGAHWVDLNLPSDDYELELDVICRENTTKVVLSSRNTLTTEDGFVVLSRFGDDEHNVPKEVWLTATDHKSVLYDGDKSAFIRGLLGAPVFKVRIMPVGGDTLDRKFSTAGLAEALRRHSDVCGWGDLIKPDTPPPSISDTTAPAPPAAETTNAVPPSANPSNDTNTATTNGAN